MSKNRCEPKGKPPLCACGCGKKARWNESKNVWAAYVNGHQNVGRKSPLRKKRPPAPLCACGCGQPVKTWRYAKGWTTYLNNHAPRQTHTPESIELMRTAALNRDVSGVNNPVWRGGVTEDTRRNHPSKRHTFKWRKLAKSIHERDSFRCILCDKTPKRLDTHHIDGDFENDDPSNLVTLCHKCHMRAEFSLEKDELRTQIDDYMQSII